MLNIKVSTLVTTCWSLHGNDHEFSVYVDLTYTGIPRISGLEIRGIQIQEYLSPSRRYYYLSHLSQLKSIVSGINIAFSLLKVLSFIFLFTLTLKNNVLSPPRPSYFVLYNTLESDVALAYLPMATVTIAVVEMIMSLVTTTKIKN